VLVKLSCRKPSLVCIIYNSPTKICRSIVVDHLQSLEKAKDVCVIPIYCDYADQSRQNLECLLGYIWKQITLQHKRASNLLTERYEYYLGELELRPGKEELMHCLRIEIESLHRAYIIVDGIDECRERVYEGLIHSLMGLPHKARILFTSRHVHSVEKLMNSSTRLEIIANRNDIASYIDKRLQPESGTHLTTVLEKSSGQISTDYIKGKILEKTNGL
jgi:hypothetical protein